MCSTATVIIRTKNSAPELPAVLSALHGQEGVHWDLLVIDSGSTDDTRECLRDTPHQWIQIQAEEYVPGPVLNQAIAASSSPLLVFLNSDALLLHPHCLKALLAPFSDTAVAATYGRQRPAPDAEPWVADAIERSFPPDHPSEWIHFALPFAALRRNLWEEHPFYDRAWGSEDTEWGIWALGQGYKVSYVPKAAVMHSQNYTLEQLYGRQFIEGEADAILSGKPAHIQWARGCKEFLRELWVTARRGRLRDLAKVPRRCWTRRLAYYRGYCHGTKRLLKGDSDIKQGQREVLSRYGR